MSTAAQKASQKVPLEAKEKRKDLRLDKVFPVLVASAEHGILDAVARNVSSGGIFVETSEPLPIGHPVQVHFRFPEGGAEIVASGEVKNHYFFNFVNATLGAAPQSIAGMGIRFTEFLTGGGSILEATLIRFRVLH